MSRSPALGELLDLLRLEGLAVGVDDHLRVERLLALETAWGEDQLRIAIRAIFAKSAQELAAFDAVWMRLFAGFAVNRPPGSSEGPPAVIQAFGWRRLIARSVLV